jgi:hypothetical protein
MNAFTHPTGCVAISTSLALHTPDRPLPSTKGEGQPARPEVVLTMLVGSHAVGQRDSVAGERHILAVALLQR